MSKTTNKLAPEVRERAVRLVLHQEVEHPSRWAAITSMAAKIGCSGHTLLEWLKKAEVNSAKRTGVPTALADRLKALERENRVLWQANEFPRKATKDAAKCRRRLADVIDQCDRMRLSQLWPLPRPGGRWKGGAAS